MLGFLKTTRSFPKIPEEVRSLPKTSEVCRILPKASSLPVLFTSKIRDPEEGIAIYSIYTRNCSLQTVNYIWSWENIHCVKDFPAVLLTKKNLVGFHRRRRELWKKHVLLGFKPVNRKSINSKRLGKLTMTTICWLIRLDCCKRPVCCLRISENVLFGLNLVTS